MYIHTYICMLIPAWSSVRKWQDVEISYSLGTHCKRFRHADLQRNACMGQSIELTLIVLTFPGTFPNPQLLLIPFFIHYICIPVSPSVCSN